MTEDNVNDLLNKNKNLLEENQKLRALIAKLDPQTVTKDNPFVQIFYYNNSTSQKYRNEIELYLLSRAFEMANPKGGSKVYTLPNGSINFINNLSNKQTSINKPSSIIGAATFYDIYVVDQIGSALYTYKNGLDQWNISAYNSKFVVPLGDIDTEDISLDSSKLSGPKCFNCGGPHILSACLQELDYKVIAKNKSEFLSKSLFQNSNRYHVDIEPRFVSFKPGHLSLQLQKALGLKQYELPPYIYKMRELGYPPGHFMESRILNSNISLLQDISEKNTLVADQISVCDATQHYDIDKIVSYEGFNTPMSHHVKDEFQRYDSIRMQCHHSKSEWLKALWKHKNAPNSTPGTPSVDGVAGDPNFSSRAKPNFSRDLSRPSDETPESPNKKLKPDDDSDVSMSNGSERPLPTTNGDGTSSENIASSSCFKGTPILSNSKRKHLASLSQREGDDSDLELYETVPAIDAFARDVQPFSYTFGADKQQTGILDRIKKAFEALKQRRRPLVDDKNME